MKLEELNLGAVLEQVGREKNINKEVLISALEEAMLSAARKKLGIETDLEARFNDDLSEIEVFEFKRIIPAGQEAGEGEIAFNAAKELDPSLSEESIGEDLGIKLDSKELGRIAAQNAKQIIIQRLREAERHVVFEEYKDRKDENVAGIARRFERGDVILDLGRSEAVLSSHEQIPRENIRINDRVVAYVVDVLESSKGSQIILSRAHPNLVVRLFEAEVPEIGEGIVTIEGAAREPGFRTKISVRSKDADVDPVGACVGMKGTRVQAVVQELKGEKIDIVPFDEDPARFVCNAIAPAEVTRVIVNEDEQSMRIVVPDDQLSLAIGRRGQNVRLASQLTGWSLDIQPESKATAEREDAWICLAQMPDLGELQFQTLFNYGIRTLEQFLQIDLETLLTMSGFENSDNESLRQEASKALDANKNLFLLSSEDRNIAKLLQLVNNNDEKITAKALLGISSLSEQDKNDLIEIGVIDAADLLMLEANVLTKAGLIPNLDREKIKLAKDEANKLLSALVSSDCGVLRRE